ncbi:MAG: ribose-phosphate pyrophosphokinase [candidate division Zixibacteria bacterium]|nr:ribose-phosphate pyrophosphokinase [candidate division Zixibacteria bacterium]
MPDELKLITGNSNKPLAEKISQYLSIPISQAEVTRFSDGEIKVKIDENIRGTDLFIIQPTNSPAENLLELLILLDATRRASARRITAVIPYFGYARQDRKDQPRVPITAKLVANLIAQAGANRVLTMDLHAAQIQGFFDIPTDHLFSNTVFFDYFINLKIPDLVIVADTGSIKMVRNFAKKLNCPMAVVDKRRPGTNQAEVLNIIGEVKDKNVIIRDDILDTGGTLTEFAYALQKKGARDIYACCTHAVLSGDCLGRVERSPIKKLVISDTINQSGMRFTDKIKVLSVARLFGEAIIRTDREESISSLFEY